MNLTGKYRYGYFAACVVFAMIYAFVTGRQPVVCRIADGAVCSVAFFFAGIALQNIFRYALSDVYRPFYFYRYIFLALLSILTTGCILGIETLAMYLCFPPLPDDFTASVPVRMFITFLWFAIVRLSFLSYEAAKPDTDTAPAILPQRQSGPVERITVRNGTKIKIIPIEEILFLQADGDYVAIHTAEGHWLKEQTMKYTEEMLPVSRFIRIHRSYIVNITHISRIERYGEQQSVILHNGVKIKISAARYQALKQRLDI
ncbi:MAG: LytTR family transcriptional regulator DNA-binding domain-containing protein [Tannerella sp.]|jgi:hypothetical protein|nr:LytTR family transcriptional regulator DNA-binding domain-containing protein [Tannerella sp.]